MFIITCPMRRILSKLKSLSKEKTYKVQFTISSGKQFDLFTVENSGFQKYHSVVSEIVSDLDSFANFSGDESIFIYDRSYTVLSGTTIYMADKALKRDHNASLLHLSIVTSEAGFHSRLDEYTIIKIPDKKDAMMFRLKYDGTESIPV
jgi:hypothetical protein